MLSERSVALSDMVFSQKANTPMGDQECYFTDSLAMRLGDSRIATDSLARRLRHSRPGNLNIPQVPARVEYSNHRN